MARALARPLIGLLLAATVLAFLSPWRTAPLAQAAGFVVNSADDSSDANAGDGFCADANGNCTLRAAIEEINAGGSNLVTFDNAYLIQPKSPLPTIAQSASIDGNSGSGTVQLDGVAAGAADGLRLAATKNEIRGLSITRFAQAGIYIEATSTQNTIVANLVGVDPSGAVGLPNDTGIIILSNDNIIGGADGADRNIISGNTFDGMLIFEGAADNTVSNNYIGTDLEGDEALGNGRFGVWISNASANLIGAAGAGNVIAGNGSHGVFISQGGVGANSGNTLNGNLIGLAATGDFAIANGGDGVATQGIVENLTVGGTTADERNVISGNLGHGFAHRGGGGAGNLRVIGNYIGVAADGIADAGNNLSGVYSEGNNLTIGGTQAGAGNVISGNGANGIHAHTRSVVIHGNVIGLGSDGTTPVGNAHHGVLLDRTQASSNIGSATGSGRNVVSGNGGHGIFLSGDPNNVMFNSGATIFNNYVGIDATGALDRGNTLDGIRIEDSSQSSVGSALGTHNVVSGNGGNGINVVSSTAVDISRNFVGTNAAAAAAVGNSLAGVRVDASSEVRVGVVAGGAEATSVISGNGGAGVEVTGDSVGTWIRNSRIGTDFDGTSPLGNAVGVRVTGSAVFTAIGGSGFLEGNLISGNALHGVDITDASAGTAIVQNFIGTTASGDGALPNGGSGVSISGTPDVFVGSSSPSQRNVISGNTVDGVRVSGPASTGSTIQGNFIGVDSTGANRLANGSAGVTLNDTTNVTVGGVVPGALNVISGNTGPGVYLTNSATGNTIVANIIGPQANGLAPLATGTGVYGVLAANGAHDNVIGSLVPAEGNQIAYHTGSGIRIQGMTSTGNVIIGNSIHSNALLGIDTFDGGNGENPPPVVMGFSAGGAFGTSSCALCRISVYSDSAEEGRNYHGTTTTDGAGIWVFGGAISGANVSATVEFPGGNTTEFSAPLDSDLDGCTDAEENGANPQFGGDRNAANFWDFFDVTADKAIDLSDTLAILDHFGQQPAQAGYDPIYDRYIPDPAKPWRTAEATGLHLGIDLQDALINLQSFGHNCSGAP